MVKIGKIVLCLGLISSACLIIAGAMRGSVSMYQAILLLWDGILVGACLPR